MAGEGISPERLQRLAHLRDERNQAHGDRWGTVGQGEWCIVIRRHPDTGERWADLLQWGLVPKWAPDRASPHMHARSETAHDLPSFRDGFKSRRCLIAASEFVERRTIGRPKGQEVAFGLANGRGFAVAGIWDAWRDGETGETVRGFAELTVDANDLVGEMHDRMPALLPPEAYSAWLGEVPATELQLRGLLRPYPPELMTCWSPRQKRPPPGQLRRPDQTLEHRTPAAEPPRQGSLL
ncbi:SOS response-associated peptidase [Mycobacterium sp. KBS0706]|uniref:SOS response-associated peptidase n=1 Tax=Mycobacterium sp. KBS0706 TaxID=2578109 RepID=UPI00110F87F9|nr:SOS response-associated peptidase [Mycobacterium sp. KBS0706]TSD83571.1 SOS response-associated peptidase [Mycobacterium sp. KBS0706]